MLTYLLSVVLLCNTIEGLVWKDCGSAGKINSLTITGSSDTSETCSLKKGTNVTCSLTFTPSQDVKFLTAEVVGLIKGIPVPFPLPNSDVCSGKLQCPLKSGQDYTYSVMLAIRDFYPQIKVVVRWRLLNENNKPIVCFALPAEIVAS